ncbi:MAG TPA: hypothetical protein VNZ03_18065 [Terriglobales bacterium]|jgi:hypothetical protein|nr:hypothetical protein [Terriglobales bacterium]
MTTLAAVALLCAAALPLGAQNKVLVAKSRVPSVAFDGYRSFALPTDCDKQGRSYVKLVKPLPGTVGPLLRLSSKGVLEAEFDTEGSVMNLYAVRPNGGVAMVRIDGPTKVVDNFAPNGKRESSVPLERPPIAFFPMQMAVFRSGEMLIAGLQGHPGYKASTAVYDPAGHLLKQFELDGDAEIERAIEVGDARYASTPGRGNDAVSRSVAITGDDGLVYLMRATSPASVYVISSAGEVIRKVVVNAPTDKGLPGFGVRVVKNRLAVEFERECDSPLIFSSCQGTVYTVVDATTGQKLADYETEDDTAGPIACYVPDPDRFFTFSMPGDEHRLEIVEAAAK